MLITDFLKNARINQMVLVDVSPAYVYEDGHKTDAVSGYKYTVVLPEYKYEKLTIKIEGRKQMDYNPEQGAVPVKVDNLTLKAYSMRTTDVVSVSATATDIRPVK